MIPHGRQHIIQEDIDAVLDVLKSDFLTEGPKVPKFEKALTNHCKAKYAVAVNSATSALHIACLALGVQRNDLVWTSPISFVASANCVLYCNATIDFIDIDPISYNISTEKLKQKLEQKRSNNLQLPKVLILVHLSGQSCEMTSMHALSKEYGFSIIEDASHAIGSLYKGEPIGNCKYSDITVFSFHPVKIITSAEGGVAMTNSLELSDKMYLFRSHGVTRDANKMTEASHGDWYYQQIELGFNYRMPELQAALGISQLKRLDSYIEKRNFIANKYDNELTELAITLPSQSNDSKSSRHLYIIRLKTEKLALTHKEIYIELKNRGIGINLHYIPIHTHPYYQDLGFKIGDFPEAEKYYSEAISIPLYPQMTVQQINYVISSLKDVIK